MHSVTDPALPACAGGCFSVLGILFEIYDGPDNVLLKTIWDNMPTREGVSAPQLPACRDAAATDDPGIVRATLRHSVQEAADCASCK